MTTSSKIGSRFAAAHPSLFKGCRCKRDVIVVMNRWKAPVEPARIERVAKRIRIRNRRYTVDQIVRMIRRAIR